ncbi:MAG: NUDIX hydrolase [Patescibacteria group bacterium]
MKKPKLISEEIIYQGSSTKVHMAKVKFESGEVVEWDHAHGSDVVVMLPLDTNNDVYLVKEWRIAWRDYVLQVPAGGVESKDEKGRLKQVHNELKEEIGMDGMEVEKLIDCMLAARTKSLFSIYLVRDLYPAKKDPDPDEYLEIIKMPFDKAYEMFISGKVLTTSYTLIAFLMVKQKLAL